MFHCALTLGGLLLSVVASAQVGRVELGAAASQADLNMGCLYPMTERAAIYGQDSIAGIQIALGELQAQREAGQQVPRLRVIIDDDQSKASYGVGLAKNFIHQDGGQHTSAILREFNFSDAEIHELVESGAVVQAEEHNR